MPRDSSESTSYSPSAAREIYDLLVLGKRVTLVFSTRQEFIKLKTRLYQIKAASEKEMIAIGFLDEADVQSLCFKKLDKENLSYKIYLGPREKRKLVTYTICCVEES